MSLVGMYVYLTFSLQWMRLLVSGAITGYVM